MFVYLFEARYEHDFSTLWLRKFDFIFADSRPSPRGSVCKPREDFAFFCFLVNVMEVLHFDNSQFTQ